MEIFLINFLCWKNKLFGCKFYYLQIEVFENKINRANIFLIKGIKITNIFVVYKNLLIEKTNNIQIFYSKHFFHTKDVSFNFNQSQKNSYIKDRKYNYNDSSKVNDF